MSAESTIWKYQLSNKKVRTELDMPLGAEILHAQYLPDGIFIWAKVRPKAATTKRTFEVFETGDKIPDGVSRRYINTFFERDGDETFVFHAFEVI